LWVGEENNIKTLIGKSLTSDQSLEQGNITAMSVGSRVITKENVLNKGVKGEVESWLLIKYYWHGK